MPRYTDESKERVRDAIDMVELVRARSSDLRRSGADAYVGRCPFHEERTPSFSVQPSRKLYYCFGCQAAGDAFDFVMATEGVEFPAALELLAYRFGVTLEVDSEDPRAAERRRRRERLLALLERTCGYYERFLWEAPEAARARKYLLEQRGLEEEVLREFRVGYAPSKWDRVLLASRSANFSEQELLATGLCQRSRDTPGRIFDRFRARIMFPLCDRRGRVLGFGARALDGAGGPAKYLNSADGEIYHKGRHLFGAHLAQAHAARAGATVLCEGYTDVIAMHQAGVRNCVGLMGTALTDDQIGELGRLAPTVLLALDADRAGQEAMLKAARAAASQRVELRVVAMPPGSDPAEVLAREGAQAVRELVDRSLPYVRFRVEQLLDAGDRATPEGRDRILEALRPVFAELGRSAMREELERTVVARLGVSEQLVAGLLAEHQRPRPAAPATPVSPVSPPAAGDAVERAERALLELCLALPREGRELLTGVDLDTLFSAPATRAVAQRIATDGEPASQDPVELGPLLAELSVRAAALAPTPAPAQLQVARRQLELASIDRSLTALRASGGAGASELVRTRERLREEIDGWLVQALEQTHTAHRV